MEMRKKKYKRVTEGPRMTSYGVRVMGNPTLLGIFENDYWPRSGAFVL